MIDLIKTFVATIFFDKRYRYIFIFIIITLLYRFCQWLIIITQNPLMPVKFIQINRDGSIQMSIARFTQNIYSNKYKLPSKISFDKCEREYYEKIYKKYALSAIKSANKGQFMIKFSSRFYRKYGQIFYDYAGKNEEKELFEMLYKNKIIFNKEDDIHYCFLLR